MVDLYLLIITDGKLALQIIFGNVSSVPTWAFRKDPQLPCSEGILLLKPTGYSISKARFEHSHLNQQCSLLPGSPPWFILLVSNKVQISCFCNSSKVWHLFHSHAWVLGSFDHSLWLPLLVPVIPPFLYPFSPYFMAGCHQNEAGMKQCDGRSDRQVVLSQLSVV